MIPSHTDILRYGSLGLLVNDIKEVIFVLKFNPTCISSYFE